MDISSVKGLSSRQARQLAREHGENLLSAAKRPGALGIFISQFKDVLVLILGAATMFSAAIGEIGESAAILAILLLNAVLGFFQQWRTEKIMESLSAMSAPEATVLRDGKEQRLKASQLVPGDMVLLCSGDRVPADGRAVMAVALALDESMLTGESEPAEKSPGEKVFMGSLVTAGRGLMQVEAIGMNTEMGSIAGMVQSAGEGKTGLQQKLSKLGTAIALICGGVCGAVIVLGLARGEPLMQMLLTGISLAVAAIPEGLPAVVTVVLAMSVGRVLKKGAVIRRLHAVETLGSCTVICSDKTGTITENSMAVSEIWAFGSYLAGGGRSIERCPLQPRGPAPPPKANRGLVQALTAVSVCTAAYVSDEKASAALQGSPTETALLAAALQSGLLPARPPKVVREKPFDSKTKIMWVLCDNGTAYAKGAPEQVLKNCSSCMTPTGEEELTGDLKSRIIGAAAAMEREGMRVLAAADSGRGFGGGRFLALFGIQDPPRKEVAAAVAACRKGGIAPVMITGDSRLTAEAVAKKVGILRRGARAVSGSEIDAMDDAALCAAALNGGVFARVSPAHKLRIVKALKASGETVVMTGDGVNDAPALREADVGIAMGITGTDVAKEAAAAVILDDNFATIISAVGEGRIICRNIRRFVRFMLGSNLGEVVTVLVGMVLGMPVIFLPIQILFINLVTDGLPALALGTDSGEDTLMDGPPEIDSGSFFGRGEFLAVILRGLVMGVLNLVSFTLCHILSGGELAVCRAAALITLVLGQMLYVCECAGGLKAFRTPAVPLAAAGSLLAVLAAVFLPALQQLFATAAPDVLCLLAAAGCALLNLPAGLLCGTESGKRNRL